MPFTRNGASLQFIAPPGYPGPAEVVVLGPDGIGKPIPGRPSTTAEGGGPRLPGHVQPRLEIGTLRAVNVAISKFRANLKSYVERARAGERIVVTDRGVPMARLGPADEENLLDRLERDGVLTRAKAKTRPIARKGQGVKATGPVDDLVSDMRRDRDARVLG